VVQDQVRGYREVEQRSVERSCVGRARGVFEIMTMGFGIAGARRAWTWRGSNTTKHRPIAARLLLLLLEQDHITEASPLM